ncbi:glycoside hydrolase family 3 N-terminal domain-containing protein [Streptomyces sp. NPDC056831]|uniref:glycoside hydrolase family 3 N-terminal domain-containing protein n=1 Tax=Streptomyces sp. NPDC056831 TaxID=3345954 RepID=UPI003685CCF8
MVEGIQSVGVGACVKHSAANNQETDRIRVSADVDERTLREIYLPAFEHVVREAKPYTVMCAHNKVNGVYASENHWLLTQVLRKEWGFAGLVMSDWGAVADRVAALAAGLDLEMPATGTDGQIAAGDSALTDLEAMSTFGEWLDHPVGGPLLREALARAKAPSPEDLAATDPTLLRAARAVPLAKFTGLGFDITTQDIDHLAAAVRSR